MSSYTFDRFGSNTPAKVLLKENEHGISIILKDGDNETVLLESIVDQWGTWYFLNFKDEENETCVAQEFETRSFLDAYIKALIELRNLSEITLESDKDG